MSKTVKRVESPSKLVRPSFLTLPCKSRRRKWMKISIWRRGWFDAYFPSWNHVIACVGDGTFLQVPGVLIIDTPGHATCRFCLFLFESSIIQLLGFSIASMGPLIRATWLRSLSTICVWEVPRWLILQFWWLTSCASVHLVFQKLGSMIEIERHRLPMLSWRYGTFLRHGLEPQTVPWLALETLGWLNGETLWRSFLDFPSSFVLLCLDLARLSHWSSWRNDDARSSLRWTRLTFCTTGNPSLTQVFGKL